MNLSYSLLRHWQRCQFATKLSLQRIKEPVNVSNNFRSTLGSMNHAGQAQLIRGGSAKDGITAYLDAHPLGLLPEGWDADRMFERSHDAVQRWARGADGFDYRDWTPEIVDERFYVKLDPPIGVFDKLAVMVDFLGTNRQGQKFIYDWKWVGKLDDADENPEEESFDQVDALDFDLQSAIYQWGLLKGPGIVVKGVGIVQGRLEEPTPFRVNKDGTVSKRFVRNSWDEYARACEQAGHAPDEGMRAKMLPFFRHHVNYRGQAEVEAVWKNIVTPIALDVSALIEGRKPAARRWDKFVCLRCPVRWDCHEGLTSRDFASPFGNPYYVAPASSAQKRLEVQRGEA